MCGTRRPARQGVRAVGERRHQRRAAMPGPRWTGCTASARPPTGSCSCGPALGNSSERPPTACRWTTTSCGAPRTICNGEMASATGSGSCMSISTRWSGSRSGARSGSGKPRGRMRCCRCRFTRSNSAKPRPVRWASAMGHSSPEGSSSPSSARRSVPADPRCGLQPVWPTTAPPDRHPPPSAVCGVDGWPLRVDGCRCNRLVVTRSRDGCNHGLLPCCKAGARIPLCLHGPRAALSALSVDRPGSG